MAGPWTYGAARLIDDESIREAGDPTRLYMEHIEVIKRRLIGLWQERARDVIEAASSMTEDQVLAADNLADQLWHAYQGQPVCARLVHGASAVLGWMNLTEVSAEIWQVQFDGTNVLCRAAPDSVLAICRLARALIYCPSCPSVLLHPAYGRHAQEVRITFDHNRHVTDTKSVMRWPESPFGRITLDPGPFLGDYIPTSTRARRAVPKKGWYGQWFGADGPCCPYPRPTYSWSQAWGLFRGGAPGLSGFCVGTGNRDNPISCDEARAHWAKTERARDLLHCLRVMRTWTRCDDLPPEALAMAQQAANRIHAATR